MTAQAQVVAVHKFELAGLGVAPFRFIGCTENRGPIRREVAPGIIQEIGSPGQPMGTCDYCGTGIATECWVVDRNGKRFKVGSDCIGKVGDAGLKRQIAPVLRDARNARTDERILAAKRLAGFSGGILTPTMISTALSALPHPLPWRAEKGDTKADWVAWMFWNGGRSGQLEAAKAVEQAQKALEKAQKALQPEAGQ